MIPSDEDNTRPITTSGMPGGHSVELRDAVSEPDRAPIQDDMTTTPDLEQRRSTRPTTTEHGHPINDDPSPSQQSPRTNQSTHLTNNPTSPQQDGTQHPAQNVGHLSARPTSTPRPRNNHDNNRQHGFRLDDLVMDVFLAHPRARVEDSPVYRVIGWHPGTSIYRLQLHRDPTGRAPFRTVRNWGQIRLSNIEDEWEELDWEVDGGLSGVNGGTLGPRFADR